MPSNCDMLSTASVSLEVKKKTHKKQQQKDVPSNVWSNICHPVERPEGKLGRVSNLPFPLYSGWFPFYNSCPKSQAMGPWIAGPAFQRDPLHMESSTTY